MLISSQYTNQDIAQPLLYGDDFVNELSRAAQADMAGVGPNHSFQAKGSKRENGAVPKG